MIPIQNIYYMLSYTFRNLNEQGYKELATEKFENTADLMAAILQLSIAKQLKKGLGKGYVDYSEPISLVRGKIDIAESIKTQSLRRNQLFCTYDNFTENNVKNRIIKSTVMLLLKGNIKPKRKKELRKLMIYFGNVSTINLYSVNWNMQYNRNNQSYRMMISVCYLIVKGLLQTNTDGKTKLMDFLDDEKMYHLYEKFVLEYYKRHYPEIITTATQIDWSLDDDMNEMLPKMQSDIHLQRDNTVLIIDTKYYSHIMQEHLDKQSIRSDHLYQIFTYVKNRSYEFGDIDNTVSGMLLYAKTDEETHPDVTYKMHGNKISVRTLDLNLPFADIAKQLDMIIKEHFEGVMKN